MKKHVKILALAIALTMLVAGFAGCGTKPAEKPAEPEKKTDASAPKADDGKVDTSKEVKLKMYLIGDGAPDFKVVYDEVNKALKEKINATLEVNFLSWAEHQQKYPVILASGEDFDLIFSATWKQYHQNAKNGAFWEISDEAIKKYAPQTLKNTSKTFLDAGILASDGKRYILPMNYVELANHSYVVRGDLMKKYNIPAIKNVNDFGKYLAAVKAEPGMIPFDGSGNLNDIMTYSFRAENELAFNLYGSIDIGQTYRITDKEYKVLTPEDLKPKRVEFYKMLRKWEEAGFWSKNAPVGKIQAKDSFKNGKSGSCIVNLQQIEEIYAATMSAHPDWDVKVFPLTPEDKAVKGNAYLSNGMAIGARSKNPERALMALDLLRNDEGINMMTTFGIKGKHYDVTADKKVKLLVDAKDNGFPPDRACPWGWRDTRYYLPLEGGMPGLDTLKKYHTDKFVENPLVNFAFDFEPVKEIHNALGARRSDVNTLLEWGLIPEADIEKKVDAELAEWKKLGSDKYFDEIKKQVDKFIKSQK